MSRRNGVAGLRPVRWMRIVLTPLTITLVLAGCVVSEVWSRSEDPVPLGWESDGSGYRRQTSSLRLRPRRCFFEVTQILLPADDPSLRQAMWAACDEVSAIDDPAARARWEQHGLRLGILHGALPAEIQDFLNQAELNEVQRVQVDHREGEDYRMTLRKTSKPVTLTLPGESEPSETDRLVGSLAQTSDPSIPTSDQAWATSSQPFRQYPEAEGLFHLTGHHDQQQIRLKMVPEIQFGQYQTQIGTRPQMHRYDREQFVHRVVRDRDRFDDLQVEMVISPDQTIVLGGRTAPGGGLGQFLFTMPNPEDERETVEQIVLVRTRISYASPGEPISMARWLDPEAIPDLHAVAPPPFQTESRDE